MVLSQTLNAGQNPLGAVFLLSYKFDKHVEMPFGWLQYPNAQYNLTFSGIYSVYSTLILRRSSDLEQHLTIKNCDKIFLKNISRLHVKS